MKNHRDVCFASDAGYTEYDGILGNIKTGCPNTPAYKSRYCSVHAITIAKSSPVVFTDDADEQVTPQASNKEGPIAMITGKRKTRQNVYYQVFQ